MNHRVFTAEEGAPSDVSTLAQTPDGTLWIGGRSGLTRFDGVRFVPYPGPSDEPLGATNISSLFAAPDGGLWIGFRPGTVSLLKQGHVTRYTVRDGLPNGIVQQFAQDRDGTMWVVARLGLAHFDGTHWEIVADEPTFGATYGVLIDRVGTLWVATVNGLFARAAGESRLRKVDDRSYSAPIGSVLAAGPDGQVWAAADTGLVRADRPVDPQRGGVVTVRDAVAPLLFDGAGNLWTSGGPEKGLLRVSSQDLNHEREPVLTAQPEIFARADGLSAGRTFALLEDSERNIWVGMDSGLHRFSRSNVVRDAALLCLPNVSAGVAFTTGAAGSMWMACESGSGAFVAEIRDAAEVSRQKSPAFTAAYRDPEGTVWFGGPAFLGHLEGGRIVTTPMPPKVQGRPVQALLRDRSGAMWISVVRRALFRVVDGKWSEYGDLDALPREYPYVETMDGSGVLWFGYTDNRIARVNGREVQFFDATHGLDVGNVLAITADGTDLWVGGELGFARFDGVRFLSIHSASGVPFTGVSGIVRARNGDLWLNGVGGISHVARAEVDRVLHDPAERMACETFDALDGVPGAPIQLRPQPSALETTDGRIWFSTTAGIVSIDATRLVRNPLPPQVTIWSLTSGSEHHPNLGAALHLPMHTRDLQIEYSAGSLTVPERVRFRYKLEGSDSSWREAGSRREALYTNLGPGHYTFRVIASNNDGVWNETGASIDFWIAAAFYQTGWFYTLCALACAAILAALYRVRMRQVAGQVLGRLEARLAERERIARELHDTLLQGMQGLIWRFQAATDRIPRGEPAREMMEQSLDRADQLLAESRDKVKDLRPAVAAATDLAEALAAEGKQLAEAHPAEFRVSVQGVSRELHPIVREEGFLIAREALGNAFRHAAAKDIEAEVSYGNEALQVRIRDNGQGISASVLNEGGTPGHFGLIGMRERAKKLGGRLEVWSKTGAGTEIDLWVPAKVAYGRMRATSRGKWFAPSRSSARDYRFRLR